MTGIEMIVKAMGINPEELMAKGNELLSIARDFKAGQDRIEAALRRVELAIDRQKGNLQLEDDALLSRFAPGAMLAIDEMLIAGAKRDAGQ